MEITEIRKAVTEEEVSLIRPIFAEAFGESPSDSFLERLNEKRDLSVLLAWSSETIIGFKIGYARFKGIYYSWLGGVAPDYRRKGIARELTRYQHRLCADRGYVEVQTETMGTNQAMLILNLREGFEVSGVHLGRKDALTVQLRKFLEKSGDEGE